MKFLKRSVLGNFELLIFEYYIKVGSQQSTIDSI